MSFPPPAELLNMNQRGHWAKWHATRVAWRDGVKIHGLAAVNKGQIPRSLPFSVLDFGFPVRSLKIRRDPHNFFPTIKVCVDGMVLAGVYGDDSSLHLATTEPTFHAAADNPNVLITITTRETP